MKRSLVAFSLWIGLLGVSHAMTASEIISRARIYLKDQSTSASRQAFSDTVLLQYISDGQREANSYAWLLVQRYSITLTAGTTEYALPSDFMASQRLLYTKTGTSTPIKLSQTSFNELDANSAGWMNTSGIPRSYYIYLTTAPVVGFVPAPGTSGAGTAQLDYVANTHDVTATTDTPLNGFAIFTPYHSGLVYYVTCRGYKAIEENALAQPYCDEWNQAIVAMKTGIMKQPDFNPGFSGRTK